VKDLEKVVERMATTEKTTIAVSREDGGKIRVTSKSWEGEKVILKDQVLEIRNVDGRLHVARKPRHHDEWGPADRALWSLLAGRSCIRRGRLCVR